MEQVASLTDAISKYLFATRFDMARTLTDVRTDGTDDYQDQGSNRLVPDPCGAVETASPVAVLDIGQVA